PQKSKYPYEITDVEVLASVYNDQVFGEQDTVSIDGVKIIQSKKNTFFKPKRLRPFILLKSGQPYSSQFSKYSSRRLSNLGTYKFVNIQYADADTLVDSLGRR